MVVRHQVAVAFIAAAAVAVAEVMMVVLPEPPKAMYTPSGEYATDQTVSVWPVKVLRAGPSMDASQTMAVLSSPPGAMYLPPSEYATDTTQLVWPVKCEGSRHWSRPTS